MNKTSLNASRETLLSDETSKTCFASKLMCVITSIAIFTLFVITVYLFVLNESSNLDTKGNFIHEIKSIVKEGERNFKEPACSVSFFNRFDCYPDAPVTEKQCVQRGCCFNPPSKKVEFSQGLPPLGIPYCYYPENYVGYKISDAKCGDDNCTASLERVTASGFPNDVTKLSLVVTFINDNSLRIKITDSSTERFEIPIPLNVDIKKRNKFLYNVSLTMDGNLVISRILFQNFPVFSTNLAQLVYSDQFLQISSELSSPYFYGIGEHKAGILRNVNWTRFTLFNRDREPVPNENLYGSQPFYIVLENNGQANGAFLYNSNAMDVILQPTDTAGYVTFRPIGGILDLFVILGSSPQDVVKKYTDIVGRTFMPPYWSLGFHLCRFGYNYLNNTKAVWQRMRDSGIPYDVQWNDIDYMEKRMDFTYDKVKFQGLPEFVDELHDNGMHYVVMTDPGVSNSEKPGTYPPYDDGVKKELFIKNSTGYYFEAKVWNTGHTVFPDFSNPATQSYWEDQFVRFHSEVKVDGIWIDMNEPSNMYNGQINGCPSSTYEDPQYLPGGEAPLRTVTVCMTAKHYSTIHYNEHNLVSYREAKATNLALRKIRPNKRPFIISRATFIGQGVHSGHWSGDIYSSWEDMRYTIPSMLNFNIYGIPMVGSDICGFNGNTTVELCARWQSLGAFYPFSRNHNDIDAVDQDPAILGPIVIEAAKKSLLNRYYLLPYLYTLFYRSHVYGETVARPLFFEFSSEVATYHIDEQFLWGSALMINPVLYPNVTEVEAYFPSGLWYNFISGENRSSKGQKYNLSIPITDIDLQVRGGSILPLQKTATTTTESRKNHFDLLVALDAYNQASGELYWDDGDSLDAYESGIYNLIQFVAQYNTITFTILKNGYATNMDLGLIKIYGIPKSPSSIIINTSIAPFQYINSTLWIEAQGFSLLQQLIVIWNF